MRIVLVVAAILVMAAGFSFASTAYAGGGGRGDQVVLPHNKEAYLYCWANTNGYSSQQSAPSSSVNLKKWFDLRIRQVNHERAPALFECQRVNRHSDVPFVLSYWATTGQYGDVYGPGQLAVFCGDNRQRVVVIRRDSGPSNLHIGCAG